MQRTPFTLPAGTMVTGPAENLIEAFFGSRYDAHIQQWKWAEYTKSYDETAVMAALRRALVEPVVIGRGA